MLDPIFFNPPDIDPKMFWGMGSSGDDYLKLKKTDVIDWGAKLDWAGLVEKTYPLGKGINEKIAAAILLPSASVGMPCPKYALEKASKRSLERALSLAMMWSNALVAKEIHTRICEVSDQPEPCELNAKLICDKFLVQRDKIKEGDIVLGQKESAQALLECLVLSRITKPANLKDRKPAL